MKQKSRRWYILALLIISMLSLFSLTSCLGTQGTHLSAFYDSGASDLTMTGTEFGQYLLFRFDTDASERTLTTPSAADIVSRFSSPIAGDISIFAVVADGSHSITIIGGPNVRVKPAALIVAGNTTRTIFCALDNVTKGSEAVTLY